MKFIFRRDVLQSGRNFKTSSNGLLWIVDFELEILWKVEQDDSEIRPRLKVCENVKIHTNTSMHEK